MVKQLRIENFTLIDHVEINFRSGFSVITGETGSGKSILLNALSLILGDRAVLSTIGNKSNKAIVEAEIDVSKFDVKDFFSENELDYFDVAIIRREISKEGRSRAFINDSPVQLAILKELTGQLIHIHSQYNTLELKRSEFQLMILDVLAGCLKDRDAFTTERNLYLEKTKLLADLKEQLTDSISKEDYNSFQLEELKSLRLDSNDYKKLAIDLHKGENAEEIKEALQSVNQVLTGDNGAVDQLGRLIGLFSKRIGDDERLHTISERLTSVRLELMDISSEADSYAEQFDFDPREIDALIARIDNYNRICQKHGIQDQEQLMLLMDELSRSSLNHTELEEKIESLQVEVDQMRIQLNQMGDSLHQKRMNAVPGIERSLKLLLNDLKLENTELVFQLSKGELNQTGCTKLDILFSPNAGVAPVPIHQAASGGELSRVMLAIQSMMSSHLQLQTILFDEIDSGVSGEVAQKMAATLSKMGEDMQVIAITHLPQVAAKGGQHFKVIKSVENGVTNSWVVDLNPNERVEEVARLMSGDQISEAAKENAKSLMND